MPSVSLINRFNIYTSKHKTLYLLGMMLFFWALFDGSFSYMVPLVITQSGYSKTFMGLILGTSSVFGAGFDIALSKIFHKAHFRRIYLVMFMFCFLCPALLMKNSPLEFFLVAMALWGFYYDLYGFGNLDFVSRKASPEEHSQSFGVIWVFRALGYTIAPLVIGAVAASSVIDFKPYFLMWLVLGISFSLFLIFTFITKKQSFEYMTDNEVKRRKIIPEWKVWKELSSELWTTLLLGALFWVMDSFFWTIGPLMSSTLGIGDGLSGLFLTFYTVPPVLLGFLVGFLTNKFGKKRTAQVSFLIACLILSTFFFLHSAYAVLGAVLFASISVAFAMPALNGAYSDYVSETSAYEKEIDAIEDFFTNIGYIIGPILAGFLADKVGNLQSFAYFGIVGALVTVFLICVTPRHITISIE